jgi:hypothetical protein
MNYHARRKTEPSQARLFSRLLGFFLHSWRWFFHTTWGFCFAIYVYFYVTRMKIEAMRSHNANIMVSLSVLFASLGGEGKGGEWDAKDCQFFLFSLSLSLSFITSLLFSAHGYYCISTKKTTTTERHYCSFFLYHTHIIILLILRYFSIYYLIVIYMRIWLKLILELMTR